MQIIVTIGFKHFLIKSPSAASNIIKHLAGAVEMDDDYDKGYYYFPMEEKDRSELKLDIVSDSQIRRCKKGDVDIHSEAAPLTLNGHATRQLT
jgi:hypothetical protein